MPALRFKTCRLLLRNVWNKKLTRIQRRIPRRLRRKRRSLRKKLYLRWNLNSYLKLQALRKLSLFYGNSPITLKHGRTEKADYIPFILNLETRLDVIPVRLHFCETLPQARQLISHRKIRVNNGMVNMTRFQVSRGDLIPIEENYVRTMGRKVRKSFYIERFVNKIVGKFVLPIRYRRFRMWRRVKTRWFRLLGKKQGCRLLLKSSFLIRLRRKARSRQKKNLKRKTPRLGGVCLGSLFAEHNFIKRNLYYSVNLLLKGRNRKEKEGGEGERNLPTRGKRNLPTPSCSFSVNSLRVVFKGRMRELCSDSTYCFFSPGKRGISRGRGISRKRRNRRKGRNCWKRRISGKMIFRRRKRTRWKRMIRKKMRIRGIELPTHYLEVNHRTPKAVVSYGPDIGHIPHGIRLKDLNLP
uniref:Ribosomal protein S4 n=2 Tax=Araucaria TaxID=25666 RepID=A0A0N7AK97_ARAHE|nr:ribosomal protein S4 [Araucaria heterophylla]QJH91737.1 ribosomal protein S4 [Araucaria heterophylla]QXE43689.1 ribosomal protein S4 [Araucaria cunninghamii]